jgi:hypothetical protein
MFEGRAVAGTHATLCKLPESSRKLLMLAGTHTIVQPAGTAAAHLVQQGVKISIHIIEGSVQLRHVAWVSLSWWRGGAGVL